MTTLQPPRPDLGTARTGTLVFVASRSACSPHLARRAVCAVVDGRPHDLCWGRTEVDVPAGRHRVVLRVGRRRGWGHVADAVPVAPGGRVEVFYRAPAMPHLPGALGPVPQTTRGLQGLAALAVVLAVVVLAAGLVVTALL